MERAFARAASSAATPDIVTPDPEEVTLRNVETLARIERENLMHRSLGVRISDAIARFCGSMAFVWIHIVWFAGWVLVNVLPRFRHFDPYPFSFLTLTVSLEAIFLTTFVLISQNRQAELADRRNQLDLQINLLSEQENSKILAMLESIMERLGIACDDPEVQALVSETKPEAILEQINRLAEQNLVENEEEEREEAERRAERESPNGHQKNPVEISR